MPANQDKPTHVDPFIAQFPVSEAPLRNVILARAGLKQPFLFKIPGKEVKQDVVKLLRMLQDYENDPSADKIAALNKQIEKLDLGVIRPNEEQDTVLIFYPKRERGQAFEVGAVYGRRFGKVKVNGDPSTGTVNNFCHIEEHVGQDGTTDVGIVEFMEGQGKFFLLNASSPHVKPNPGKGRIKYFSDPAHSNTTIFEPFLEELLQNQHPDMPVVITHGMSSEKPNFQLLMGNCFNGKFFRNGRNSFANLLAIALAQQDIGKSGVAVSSTIPGFIVRDGKKISMSPKPNGTPGALKQPRSVINTNVSGHIGNFAQNSLINRGRQTDRTIHLECGVRVRAVEKNPNRPNIYRTKFSAALQNAIHWYGLYDPAIHDPWALEQRFPEVYNDMSKYGELFKPEFMAEYRKRPEYATASAQMEQLYADAAESLGRDASLARIVAADNEDPDPEDSDDEEDFDLGLEDPVEDDTPPSVEDLEAEDEALPEPILFRPKRSGSKHNHDHKAAPTRARSRARPGA
jgi:hypothetical protein